MTISSNLTADGFNVCDLKPFSSKNILRQCDGCKREDYRSLCDINTKRRKHNSELDYCHKCSFRFRNSRENHPRFQGGHLQAGYKTWRNALGKRVREHRFVMEKFLSRSLRKHEFVHHIDGNKLNNDIDNLLLCDSNSAHRKVHAQLEKVAYEAITRGMIVFDKKTGRYKING